MIDPFEPVDSPPAHDPLGGLMPPEGAELVSVDGEGLNERVVEGEAVADDVHVPAASCAQKRNGALRNPASQDAVESRTPTGFR